MVPGAGRDADAALRLLRFPSCTGFGRLDIADATLPNNGAYYLPLAGSGRARVAVDDLETPALGFSNPYKKYLVYFDGPSDNTSTCGQAGGDFLHGPDHALVYVQSCTLVNGDVLRPHVALHELLHAMGAVAPGAPNNCRRRTTVTCAIARSTSSTGSRARGRASTPTCSTSTATTTTGRTAPRTMRKSAWLTYLDAQVQSDVVIGGTGTGTVQSDLPGLNCPGTCSAVWNQGSQFTLTATAGPNTRFVHWLGPCSGTDVTCAVTMSGGVHADAVFARRSR